MGCCGVGYKFRGTLRFTSSIDIPAANLGHHWAMFDKRVVGELTITAALSGQPSRLPGSITI
jgi:hypothetical protein